MPVPHRPTLALAAVLGSVLAAPAASAQGYTFTTFSAPGAYYTTAYGINDAGQIVGLASGDAGNRGFLYSGGTFSAVAVPGAYSTIAYGINNAGQIVGGSSDDLGNAHGFLATAEGAVAVVPEPATFALVAAGLGVVGVGARRRRGVTA